MLTHLMKKAPYVLLVVLPLSSTLAPARAQTMLDIATDATDPRNLRDSEPSIAVNPMNPSEISIVTFSEPWGGGSAAPIWRSTDGGLSWTKIRVLAQPPSLGKGPADQHIGYDSQGNLFLVELDFREETRKLFNYIYRQNPMTGQPHLAGKAYGNDQPLVGVDRSTGPCSHRVYSAWLNTDLSIPRSMVSKSANSGVDVDDIGAGDNSTFQNRTTRIAVGNNGHVFIVYKSRHGATSAGFENVHFRVLRSDDCGANFLSLGASGVSVHGDAMVQTWFTDAFGNPAKGKTNRARSSDAWIAVDPSDGDVYVAYVSKDSSGFGQIYVARSRDEGTTWTTARVTDGTHHSAVPEIAVAANGAVGVLYIDYDDSGSRTIFRHRFARSFNDGINWTEKNLQDMDPNPIENAADSFIWGDYEGLTAAGNTFYGVFTGQSIGRTKLQTDPIFFKEPATP